MSSRQPALIVAVEQQVVSHSTSHRFWRTEGLRAGSFKRVPSGRPKHRSARSLNPLD